MNEPALNLTIIEEQVALPAQDLTGTPFPMEAWHAALARQDVAACLQMAETAGAQKQHTAVSALCALLTPPQGFWHRRGMQKNDWPLARVAAVNALREIGDPHSLRALAGA